MISQPFKTAAINFEKTDSVKLSSVGLIHSSSHIDISRKNSKNTTIWPIAYMHYISNVVPTPALLNLCAVVNKCAARGPDISPWTIPPGHFPPDNSPSQLGQFPPCTAQNPT